jgi:four helix bundle protein
MAKIDRFEDIEAWQGARGLAKGVYTISGTGAFARDWGLRDQIRRASVSVLSNIAEGFERGGNKEFIQFLYIAKGSCGEVRSQLYIAKDQNYITEEQFQNLTAQCVRISKMLAGFITYLQRSPQKGSRLKVQS